jgi:Arc/MetJ-type ribon-helix-helix transcriptional regulator
VIRMKTTLILPDPVAARLKREAARRGVTMSALVEEALRRLLDAPDDGTTRLPTLPRFDSGGALVDIADRDALHDAMDGR